MTAETSTAPASPRPTASEAVREMRAAGRAGDPVPATRVNGWATTLMSLFGDQRAVRLEQWGGSYWYQIDEKQWYRAVAAGESVRALYTQPLLHEVRRVGENRDHIWSADRTHCTVCNDPFDWADPYCNPPKPPVPIAVKPQPFNPSWVLPVLDRLERALKRESKRERDEWDFRISQLRRSIEEHTKEKSP